MFNKIPEFIIIYEDAIAGIKRDESLIRLKMKKSLGLKLARKVTKKRMIYRKGQANSPNPKFYYQDFNYPVPISIADLGVFLRSCVKPHKRSLVTKQIVEEVTTHWLDASLGLTKPLPQVNHRYPVLINGYFDILKRAWHKNKYQKYSPGNAHFIIHAEYSKKDCLINTPQLLFVLGQTTTGFRMKRNLDWCNSNIGDSIVRFLKVVLPDNGAVHELSVSALKPDYYDAAVSDSHCEILKITEATDISATLFAKLKILAQSQKPVLIVSDFLPFIPDGVDIDEAMNMQASLRIVNEVTLEDLTLIDPSDADNISVVVSSSLRAVSDLLSSIEGDVCPAAQNLLQRADPNNIKEMLKTLFDAEIVDTNIKSDIIPVQELTTKLKAFVTKAGGDGSKVTINGVGKYLKDLKIRKDNIKIPGSKCKVSSIIGYRWKDIL